MPITEAPPNTPSEQRKLRRDLPHDPAELHLLIEELVDERDSGGWREAVWISVILLLVIVLLFLRDPKFFPDRYSSDEHDFPECTNIAGRILKYLLTRR